MANRHMKRYSTSLINRGSQIKTTGPHFIPVKIAIIKKRGGREKGLSKALVRL